MTGTPDVAVATTVARSPGDVWAAVADPARVATWSPETSRVSGAPAGPLPVGARFAGSNRHGAFRWTTRVEVVESSPGEAFAFDVSFLGMSVARWRYVIEPDGDGSRVEEQFYDHRGTAMRIVGILGTGVRDRRAHNERTMRATLEALRADLTRS